MGSGSRLSKAGVFETFFDHLAARERGVFEFKPLGLRQQPDRRRATSSRRSQQHYVAGGKDDAPYESDAEPRGSKTEDGGHEKRIGDQVVPVRVVPHNMGMPTTASTRMASSPAMAVNLQVAARGGRSLFAHHAALFPSCPAIPLDLPALRLCQRGRKKSSYRPLIAAGQG